MDMVVVERSSSPWFNVVGFLRAMNTHAFPMRPFLAFLLGQHSSILGESVSTPAIHRVAALVLVRGRHDEWMQSAALVVVVVPEGQEGINKRRRRRRRRRRRKKNDKWGGGGAAVATAIFAALVRVFVFVSVRLVAVVGVVTTAHLC